MAPTSSDLPTPQKGGVVTTAAEQHKKNKAAKKKANAASMHKLQAEAHNSEAGKAEFAKQKQKKAEEKKAAKKKKKKRNEAKGAKKSKPSLSAGSPKKCIVCGHAVSKNSGHFGCTN